jgi:hypothetical protein
MCVADAKPPASTSAVIGMCPAAVRVNANGSPAGADGLCEGVIDGDDMGSGPGAAVSVVSELEQAASESSAVPAMTAA